MPDSVNENPLVSDWIRMQHMRPDLYSRMITEIITEKSFFMSFPGNFVREGGAITAKQAEGDWLEDGKNHIFQML